MSLSPLKWIGFLLVAVLLGALLYLWAPWQRNPVPQAIRQRFSVPEKLWDRPITDICMPGSHNSFNRGRFNTNVDLSITDQIDLGVRFLEIDVYAGDDDALWVYHGTPLTGKWRFEAVLNEIEKGLIRFPNAIFFVKLENHAPNDLVVKSVKKHLGSYLFLGKSENAPSYRELLESGKRILITGGPEALKPHLPYFGTQVGNRASLDHLWPPEVYRGKNRAMAPGVGLRVTAVVLDRLGRGHRNFSYKINQFDYLDDLVSEAWRINGKIPGQLIVDFPSLGQVFEVAEKYNEMPRFMGKLKCDGQITIPYGAIEWVSHYPDQPAKKTIKSVKFGPDFSLPVPLGKPLRLEARSAQFKIDPPRIIWTATSQDTLVEFKVSTKIKNL